MIDDEDDQPAQRCRTSSTLSNEIRSDLEVLPLEAGSLLTPSEGAFAGDAEEAGTAAVGAGIFEIATLGLRRPAIG